MPVLLVKPLTVMFVCLQVVDIMRVNVDKVLERDQKLSELDDRAGELFVAYIMSVYYVVTSIFFSATFIKKFRGR